MDRIGKRSKKDLIMKKKLIYFATLALAMGMFSACKKDKADESWKEIPSTIITAESGDATLTVNGIPDKIGNVKFVANSASAGEVTLSNIIPGYNSVVVPVSMANSGKDVYKFDGKVSLSSAPAMIQLFEVAKKSIYDIAVSGEITMEGKVTLAAETAVSEAAQGGIAGTWKTADQIVTDPSAGTVKSSPIMLKWTSKNEEVNKNLANLSNVGSLFGSMALFNYLQSVTFNADGNITASYYDGDFEMAPMNDAGKLTATHDDWKASPKGNFAFWYTAGEYIFIVPNFEAMSDDDSADEPGETPDFDIKDMISSLKDLKEYGVDVTALVTELTKIMKQGFVLKFAAEGNGLKVYADKSICGNIITAIIPAAKMLDTVLPELIKDNPEAAQYVQMIKGFLGIEKFADLEAIWKATDEFCITLSFTK